MPDAKVSIVAVAQKDGKTAIEHLANAYPARLLVPKTASTMVGAYMVTYGGGLVDGDGIHADITLHPNAQLALLTQGSTKVYRRNANATRNGVKQSLSAHVAAGALFCVLPEPITPFAEATYRQTQSIHLCSAPSWSEWASLLLLDWYTSGRKSRGEVWQQTLFSSHNRVHVDDRMVLRDAWELTGGGGDMRVGPYHVYATVIVFGPQVEHITRHLLDKSAALKLKPQVEPMSLVWTCSPIEMKRPCSKQEQCWGCHRRSSRIGSGECVVGAMLRLAALETFDARSFLIEHIIDKLTTGDRLFQRQL